MLVYLATTPISRKAAALAKNGWADDQGVITVVLDSEAAALKTLGLEHGSIDQLIA